ncbi:TetR/AcrR family transcriptional regulator [Nocardia cyriacigeorgica]|uniref:TetR/AcrR family transcriptional regulator n=1 Tax=Nocardia cyriacigeorgica TaxID=135487 RepID=UPI001895B6BC|nr:TetR/AcrR family transcriptional regulator [Nocardia cyriacigeorgica]MBF6100218.1 TetR/AcrR family transcriptional regulator [Nocardia cyriacigeorgica]MBF6398769.1 TetR/AcrR family transcriptional regulator [Nocardia cyriacigeorgica]MBF6403717.1 TetR/AcrR family transcriptional regulator [Nocardia cyriacigeorgica]
MSDSPSTRQRLAATAMRMFAERGIDAVSLRELTAAAGQRNKVAAQYHFGTKERLVQAIFEQYTGRVNQRRWTMLADLGYNTRRLGIPELVDALVSPLAETATPPDGHYVRFLAAASTPPWVHALAAADPAVTSSVRAVFSALADQVAHLPLPVVRTRLSLAMILVVNALAGLEPTADADPTRRALFIANIIDATVGMLTGPVSGTATDLVAGSVIDTTDPSWSWHILIGPARGE